MTNSTSQTIPHGDAQAAFERAVEESRQSADQSISSRSPLADNFPGWLECFDHHMHRCGFVFTAAPCACKNPDRGHKPECGFTEESEDTAE